MCFFKYKNEERSKEVEEEIRKIQPVFFTNDEIYAYYCLIFSNDGAMDVLGKKDIMEIVMNPTFNTMRLCYAIWLIETKRYQGCQEEVMQSLLGKLKGVLIEMKTPPEESLIIVG